MVLERLQLSCIFEQTVLGVGIQAEREASTRDQPLSQAKDMITGHCVDMDRQKGDEELNPRLGDMSLYLRWWTNDTADCFS